MTSVLTRAEAHLAEIEHSVREVICDLDRQIAESERLKAFLFDFYKLEPQPAAAAQLPAGAAPVVNSSLAGVEGSEDRHPIPAPMSQNAASDDAEKRDIDGDKPDAEYSDPIPPREDWIEVGDGHYRKPETADEGAKSAVTPEPNRPTQQARGPEESTAALKEVPEVTRSGKLGIVIGGDSDPAAPELTDVSAPGPRDPKPESGNQAPPVDTSLHVEQVSLDPAPVEAEAGEGVADTSLSPAPISPRAQKLANQIRAALAEHPTFTAGDIATLLGIDHNKVSAICATCKIPVRKLTAKEATARRMAGTAKKLAREPVQSRELIPAPDDQPEPSRPVANGHDAATGSSKEFFLCDEHGEYLHRHEAGKTRLPQFYWRGTEADILDVKRRHPEFQSMFEKAAS